MKTAVEKLVEEINKLTGLTIAMDEPCVEQAKEIEKEHIVEAFFQGVDRESDGHGAMYLCRKDAEQYYNETFKQQEQ
jgi:predicted ATP-grasp superfamily ATP-dependent carboligase